jgi:hypothetical protein
MKCRPREILKLALLSGQFWFVAFGDRSLPRG